MARRILLQGTIETLDATETDAASATSLTIVAAVSGQIPHLHGIVISTDTAGTYSVKIGSTTKLTVYLGANGGYDGKFHPFYLKNNTANEGISITKPSGATASATCFYTLEPALS